MSALDHWQEENMDEARAVARKMLKDPEHALDTLAREVLGLNPDDLGSPWGTAIFSFRARALRGGARMLLIGGNSGP